MDSAHQNWLESIPISFFYDFLKISKKISKIKKPPWNFYFWFFSKTDFRFGFSASNLTTIDTHLNFFDFLKILKKSKKGGPKMKKKNFFNANQFWFTFSSYPENFSSIGLLFLGAEIFIFDFLKMTLQNPPLKPPMKNFWKFLFCQNLPNSNSGKVKNFQGVFTWTFFEKSPKNVRGGPIRPPPSLYRVKSLNWK